MNWSDWKRHVAEDARTNVYVLTRLPFVVAAFIAAYAVAFRIVWGAWPGW